MKQTSINDSTLMNPNELLQVILEIFSTQPSHDELVNNMHSINRIIANDPVGHLSNTNCDDFSILHLLAERGWTDAFLVVLWLCHYHQVPNCFGLVQESDHGVTPIQLLAYDHESMDHFCNYVHDSFPEWFERGDFSSAIVLERMLFCNDESEEFLWKMRNLIRRYPHSLDPSLLENDGRSSLLHRYCEGSIGSLDSNILGMLIEEGMDRQHPCLMNGGLTVENRMKETPLFLILRNLLVNKTSEWKDTEFSWECVDTCVNVVGVAAVLAGWIYCVPMRFCTIGMHHLASVKVVIDRYRPLLENLSEFDLLQLYGAFEQVCSLPFDGKREAKHYETLYQLCQLEGKTQFMTYDSENIFYTAIRRNLDWSRGLQYMKKDSATAISERTNQYDLPAPLFAAAVHGQLDTIYELFRADTGLFESVSSKTFYMDMSD